MEKSVRLIIDIPRKTVEHIRSDYGHGIKALYSTDIGIVCDAIYNAIPCEDQKQGEWIAENNGYEETDYKCPFCGHYELHSTYNFCPNCGADLS